MSSLIYCSAGKCARLSPVLTPSASLMPYTYANTKNKYYASTLPNAATRTTKRREQEKLPSNRAPQCPLPAYPRGPSFPFPDNSGISALPSASTGATGKGIYVPAYTCGLYAVFTPPASTLIAPVPSFSKAPPFAAAFAFRR
jgi:hypothetical protein